MRVWRSRTGRPHNLALRPSASFRARASWPHLLLLRATASLSMELAEELRQSCIADAQPIAEVREQRDHVDGAESADARLDGDAVQLVEAVEQECDPAPVLGHRHGDPEHRPQLVDATARERPCITHD